MIAPSSIDEYIQGFPVAVQSRLQQVRKAIQLAAPNATEKISYAMPAFYLNGNIVYFAGYKNHIGFYPTSSGIRAFTGDIIKYKSSKGAVQFPHDKRLPVTLIKKIVRFRVKEMAEKAGSRKK
jgi:uncharacterized protein YdhG (YjbR/CyaY superfamily)